jgi:TonB family protein
MVFFATAAAAQQTAPKIIRGGILNGKAVSLPKPDYPDAAKIAGVGGTIRVEVTINESGFVEAAKAVRDESEDSDLAAETSDARSLLRDAAEQAALKAQFTPTLLSGVPVKVAGTIVYNFIAGDKKVMDGGVLNGKAVEFPRAAYPAAAKAVRASGMVVVQVLVDEAGSVIQATAVSGHPLLRAAAVEAARAARFAPTYLEGKPVRFSGMLTYNFVADEVQ